RTRSSITELSFHGIHTFPHAIAWEKVLPMSPVQNVTYVSGRTFASDGALQDWQSLSPGERMALVAGRDIDGNNGSALRLTSVGRWAD
ncbi:MAG: hypothetical protein AB7F74_04040, partial [Parvibaculaceae bacterium]